MAKSSSSGKASFPCRMLETHRLAYPPKGISLSKPERNRPPKSKILNATDHSAKRSLFKGRHHLDGLAHVVSFLYLVNAIARFRFRFTGFGGECPALLTIYGCGTVSAAALAVAGGGNPERLKSEAEFASLCGVAPLLASSGKTERHRLNRGGDRRANRALYQIAVTRMSYDQRTKDYVGKRKRDGKSKKEAIRCLKRYIAREVFRALRNPFEIKGPSWKDLRPARQALGITLVEAGKALNVGFQKVSYAETGRLMNVQFLEEYDAWLKSQAKKASWHT